MISWDLKVGIRADLSGKLSCSSDHAWVIDKHCGKKSCQQGKGGPRCG